MAVGQFLPGGILPLAEQCLVHEKGVQIVDDTLEEHEGHGAGEHLLILPLSILSPGAEGNKKA